jgi:hypothetical protein
MNCRSQVCRQNIHTTRTRQHLGSLRRKATRNGASGTYVSTFDYQ